MNKINELTKEQKKDQDLLLSKILDKIKLSQTRNKIQNSDFLNLAEQMIIEKEISLKRIENCIMYGGYTNAERKILIAFPEFYKKVINEEEKISDRQKTFNEIVTIIRIELPKELHNTYEHKTYLGALIKLGLKREKIGDILVREDGADIIISKEIEKFILLNLKSLIRFQKSKIYSVNMEELKYTEPKKQIIKINVSSMRLDCIVSEIARCSRNEAIKLIKEERVFVNFKEEIVASKKITENTYITIRGKGRFKINKIVSTTRSGRLVLEVEK